MVTSAMTSTEPRPTRGQNVIIANLAKTRRQEQGAAAGPALTSDHASGHIVDVLKWFEAQHCNPPPTRHIELATLAGDASLVWQILALSYMEC